MDDPALRAISHYRANKRIDLFDWLSLLIVDVVNEHRRDHLSIDVGAIDILPYVKLFSSS